MSLTSIDPIQTGCRVVAALAGRVLLFFAAGWCGSFLGRLALAFESWGDLADPAQAVGSLFDVEENGIAGELLVMALWMVDTGMQAADASAWLYLLAFLIVPTVFLVFVFSEQPAPAWWIGLAAFVALIQVVAGGGASLVSWLMLAVFLTGLGSAFWWALRVWHPELVESAGDWFQGRSRTEPATTTPRRKAPPGAWPEPVKGWDEAPRPEPRKEAGEAAD